MKTKCGTQLKSTRSTAAPVYRVDWAPASFGVRTCTSPSLRMTAFIECRYF